MYLVKGSIENVSDPCHIFVLSQVNILAHTTDAHISTEQLTKIRKLLKRHKAQCQRESSLIIADKGMANEVNGRSSLNGEDKEDSGFQNVTEDELHLRKRVTRVFSSSATSHERSAMSPKTCNMSYGVGYDSETDSDSEATLPCYESVLSSDTSDQRKLRDHTQSSNFYRKKVVSESSGAQWDVFRRQDVPKLIEYLERHSSEFSHMYGFHKQVSRRKKHFVSSSELILTDVCSSADGSSNS